MRQLIADREAFAAWCALPVTERVPFIWPLDRSLLPSIVPSLVVESEVF